MSENKEFWAALDPKGWQARAEAGRLAQLRLRKALISARAQLITLGGDVRKYPQDERDMIQADVLEQIEKALREA
jgi:hypothetical protein